MPEVGTIRERRRRSARGEFVVSWRIDFYRDLPGPAAARANSGRRYLSGWHGTPFASRAEAEVVRQRIGERSREIGLEAAIDEFRRPDARRDLVTVHAQAWLERAAVELSPRTGRRIAPYTLASYRRIVERHFGFWELASVHDLTTANLRAWVGQLAAEGLAGKTIRNALVPVRCIVRDLRIADPAFPVPVFPVVAADPPRPRRMPLGDILAVLDALPEDRLGIYLALFYTLARPGEMRAARVEDYDFRAQRLDVCRAAKTPSGVDLVEGRTKTGASGRYPVPDELHAWITRWRGDARLDRAAPLFPNPETGSAWSDGRLGKWWRRAMDDARVPHIPLYRALKHSPGTALLEAGLSREDMQAAFRHASVRTQGAYDVEDEQRRRRAVERLQGLVDDERERKR